MNRYLYSKLIKNYFIIILLPFIMIKSAFASLLEINNNEENLTEKVKSVIDLVDFSKDKRLYLDNAIAWKSMVDEEDDEFNNDELIYFTLIIDYATKYGVQLRDHEFEHFLKLIELNGGYDHRPGISLTRSLLVPNADKCISIRAYAEYQFKEIKSDIIEKYFIKECKYLYETYHAGDQYFMYISYFLKKRQNYISNNSTDSHFLSLVDHLISSEQNLFRISGLHHILMASSVEKQKGTYFKYKIKLESIGKENLNESEQFFFDYVNILSDLHYNLYFDIDLDAFEISLKKLQKLYKKTNSEYDAIYYEMKLTYDLMLFDKNINNKDIKKKEYEAEKLFNIYHNIKSKLDIKIADDLKVLSILEQAISQRAKEHPKIFENYKLSFSKNSNIGIIKINDLNTVTKDLMGSRQYEQVIKKVNAANINDISLYNTKILRRKANAYIYLGDGDNALETLTLIQGYLTKLISKDINYLNTDTDVKIEVDHLINSYLFFYNNISNFVQSLNKTEKEKNKEIWDRRMIHEFLFRLSQLSAHNEVSNSIKYLEYSNYLNKQNIIVSTGNQLLDFLPLPNKITDKSKKIFGSIKLPKQINKVFEDQKSSEFHNNFINIMNLEKDLVTHIKKGDTDKISELQIEINKIFNDIKKKGNFDENLSDFAKKINLYDIEQQVKTNELILYFYETEKTILRFDIRRNKSYGNISTNLFWFSKEDLTKKIKSHLLSLDDPLRLIDKKNANKVYQILFRDIAKTTPLEKGIDFVSIIPSQTISNLPFGTLINDNKKYLINNLKFSYYPSIQHFHYQREHDIYRLGVDLDFKKKNPGILITKVHANTNAHKRLKKNDVIIKINGIGIDNYKHSEILWKIRDIEKGKILELTIFRNNKYINLIFKNEITNSDIYNYDFVGIGNPTFNKANSKKILLNTDILRTTVSKSQDLDIFYSNLSHLPETKDEILAGSNAFDNSKIFLLDEASEESFYSLQNMRINILSIATHAVEKDNLVVKEPALVLSYNKKNIDRGLLTASEIIKNQMNIDLVILSACKTIASGKGSDLLFSGLARSFYMSGAKKMMISRWPVDSQSTAELMKNFYSNIKTNSYSDALREAILDHKEKYSHPFYWSSFMFLGS